MVVVRMFMWAVIVFILSLSIDWPTSSVMFIAAVGAIVYSFVRWGIQ